MASSGVDGIGRASASPGRNATVERAALDGVVIARRPRADAAIQGP